MATSLEPPTTARAVLETSKGPLEIELWAKETPLASRNFLQRCAEGYYDGKTFHRVVRGFVAQAGSGFRDDSKDSFFADELHSRLKFTSRPRGILGTANMNGKKNSNGSQFIITLGNGPQTQALNGKSTVFGRVVGESVYNLAKIESEGEMLEDGETPMYPTVINSTRILEPYFDDLVYKKTKDKPVEATKPVKKKTKAKVRLSYDDDEGEEGTASLSARPAKKRFKMKAAHEVMNDKSLVLESKEPAIAISKPTPAPKPTVVPPKNPSAEPEPEPVPQFARQVDIAPIPKAKTAAELEKEFELMKSSLRNSSAPSAKSQPTKSTLSAVELEREAYLLKQPVGRKKDNDKRESLTLALLNKFTSKLAAAGPTTSTAPTTSAQPPLTKNSLPEDESDDDSLYESDEDDDGDLYSHRFVPEHIETKDDSLITQFTGTKHNDNKFAQEDPEFLLLKKKTADAAMHKVDVGKRSGALMSTQKLREELRKKKLEQLSNQE